MATEKKKWPIPNQVRLQSSRNSRISIHKIEKKQKEKKGSTTKENKINYRNYVLNNLSVFLSPFLSAIKYCSGSSLLIDVKRVGPFW